MNLPRPSMRSLWRRRTRAAAPVAAAFDPADMGTCFGLELSLGPTAATARTSSPKSADAAPWWDSAEVRKSCGA